MIHLSLRPFFLEVAKIAGTNGYMKSKPKSILSLNRLNVRKFGSMDLEVTIMVPSLGKILGSAEMEEVFLKLGAFYRGLSFFLFLGPPLVVLGQILMKICNKLQSIGQILDLNE